MRLSRTVIKAKFLRNIQSVGVSDSNIDTEFDYQLGVYYQLMLAKLKNYKTYISSTFSTVASTQYYSNPPGYVTSDGIVITVGSVNYPLKLISSEYLWEQLNAVLLQASALPQFYFPRRDDFGVWPIPQAVYTGTIYYHYRDRNLMVDDYAAGTITVTSGSATVTGSGTAFTAGMVGRWLFIDDTTVPGHGYEYRITGYTSATSLTLARTFVGTTTSGISSYRIGETPEIPEELHQCLADGVTAGYYADIRKDPTNAQMFLNKFYTGDMVNASRNEGDTQIAAGLIGGINRYNDREDERIIDRRPQLNPLQWKPWSTVLSL